MDRTTKIILAAAAVAAVLLVCGAIVIGFGVGGVISLVGRNFETNPAQVTPIATDIADFDLPTGYKPTFGMSIAGFKVVSYDPGDGNSHIWLMQAPAGTELEGTELQREFQRMSERGPVVAQTRNLKQINSEQIKLRGQEVTLITSEGTNSDGASYRQCAAYFNGKGGPAMVIVEQPIARWNQEQVNQFLASIR